MTPFDLIKILVLAYIVSSPFLPTSKSLDSQFFKIIFLILIVIATFADIQLGIVLAIAFLVFTINQNKPYYKKARESFYAPKEEVAPPIPQLPEAKCNDMSYYREQISNDLFEIYIDDKVKPYEESIKRLTSPELLNMVQDNSVSF